MFSGLLVALGAGISSLFGDVTKVSKTVLGQSLSSGSLARLTHATSVEPITLVDNTLEMSDRLDGVLELCVNIYASIYARAISTRNTSVNGSQIIKRLESLNPTNTSMRSLSVQYGLECLKDQEHSTVNTVSQMIDEGDTSKSIPDYTLSLASESFRKGMPLNFGFAFENDNTGGNSGGGRGGNQGGGSNRQPPGEYEGPEKIINKGRDAGTFKDKPELSFGKVVEYELKADGDSFNVPVSFRLATSLVDNPSIVNAMISRFKSEETALERKVKWKTKSITALTELLFCTDLVRQDYKNMISDKSGVYRKLRPQASGEYTRALLRGEVSVAQASNILVISRATADQVEARTGGRFEDQQFRQKMLENTGIMILVIIDPISDIISMYIESMPRGHRIPGRNVVAASKKSGPDIEQILAVLTTGRGNLI